MGMFAKMNWKSYLLIIGFLGLVAWAFWSAPPPVQAQQKPGDVVSCGPTQNFSKSPGYASADPFMVADKAGTVHLFWAERVTGGPDAVPNAPDAIMYSGWNGESWSSPVDLFLSPAEMFNRRINAIRGTIDGTGYLHLTWIGPDNTYFYSHVHASQANDVTAWSEPLLVANDQSGSQYSADINTAAENIVHIVYGREPEEGSNQVVTHIRSDDGGLTWSAPHTIYTVPYTDRGASNIRVWVNGPETVYATWTEWDTSGNGQAVFFSRSFDKGDTWETPYRLAERQGIEYERDWTTLAVLGEDDLVVFWEGGYRAYRQAQYSQDGGQTWTRPKDTLDWLIADNGFAEFVRDGSDNLHLFVFQRVREGNDDRNPFGGQGNGLWHSVWEGGNQWRQPQMVGDPNTGNFVSVAIRGGNELFAAWFSYIGLELSIIQCELQDVEAVPLEPWPEEIELNVPEVTPVDTITDTTETVTTTVPTNPSISLPAGVEGLASPGQPILLGMLPTIFVIALTVVVVIAFQKRRQVR